MKRNILTKLALFCFLISSYITVVNAQYSDTTLADVNTVKLTVNPLAEEPLTIYPSPSNGLVHINFSRKVETPKVQIYDLLGNRVTGLKLERVDDGLFVINFSGMKNGLYFISIQDNETFVTRRITFSD
jgi:lysyl endopeptidase